MRSHHQDTTSKIRFTRLPLLRVREEEQSSQEPLLDIQRSEHSLERQQIEQTTRLHRFRLVNTPIHQVFVRNVKPVYTPPPKKKKTLVTRSKIKKKKKKKTTKTKKKKKKKKIKKAKKTKKKIKKKKKKKTGGQQTPNPKKKTSLTKT